MTTVYLDEVLDVLPSLDLNDVLEPGIMPFLQTSQPILHPYDTHGDCTALTAYLLSYFLYETSI